MKIHKEDQVTILSGNDSGKTGRVLKVFPENNKIIVEGVNFIKKHTRPSQKQPQGGIVTKEAPINASNVLVICPKCNKKTKVGFKTITDETKGKTHRVRYCKKCGEMIVRASSK
ncbi:50S ribosomal protein L24 [candidate division KSB1 bacterium]|nr:50S ribosomal protein L24 [candidate division KSB1 bacterium]